MGILCSLAKFIADTALEWFPKYTILSVLRLSLAPLSYVHVSAGRQAKIKV